MIRCLLLLGFALPLVVAASPYSPTEVLIFEDTFDTFNLSIWKHDLTLSGEGNWEFEWYTNNRSVSFVTNGTLHISPKFVNNSLGNGALNSEDVNIWGGDPATYCTDNGYYGCERTGGAGGNILNPIQSARLNTASSFVFKYGRVEFTAKLPKGDWFWPAMWLMPASGVYGSTWPTSGEVDIIESRGNDPSYPGGCDTVSSTLHWGPFWPEDAYELTTGNYTITGGTDFTQTFHTFGFYWNSTIMYTYVDEDLPTNRILKNITIDQPFWNRGGWNSNPSLFNPWQYSKNMNAPFDERFYIIMNLAVGGTNGYFPDGIGNKPWSNTSPNAINEFWNAVNQWGPSWTSDFEIDSVRVWQDPAMGGDYAFRVGF